MAAGLAISGVFDLAALRDSPHVNDKVRLSEQEIQKLSPMRRPIVNKPLGIAYGTGELPAMIASSRDYHAYRSQGHAPGDLIPIAHTNHFTILDELTRRARDGSIPDLVGNGSVFLGRTTVSRMHRQRAPKPLNSSISSRSPLARSIFSPITAAAFFSSTRLSPEATTSNGRPLVTTKEHRSPRQRPPPCAFQPQIPALAEHGLDLEADGAVAGCIALTKRAERPF